MGKSSGVVPDCLFKAVQVLFKFVHEYKSLTVSALINKLDDKDVARCRRLIEEKLDWASSEHWSTLDFERLSEQISQQTGIHLSIATLKRVWGRVKYDSSPTATTLNALAAFVGYATWQVFKHASLSEPPLRAPLPPVGFPVNRTRYSPPKAPMNPWWLIVGLGLGLISMLALLFHDHSSSRPLLHPYFFSSRPVAKGVPNSVVFRYDARASPVDSVFIQQSWDPRRRQRVPKNGHDHTSIYYLPGYYRAKLVVGRQTVRAHDVLIPSQGWLSVVMQEPVPVYFASNEARHDGVLNLSVTSLERHHIALMPHPPIVSYMYVHPLEGLRSDNFIFETRVKNDYQQGAAACQNAQITILCRDDMFSFPLCATGCVGELGIYLAGHRTTSKYTDLSAFGTAMSQWVDVRLVVEQKHIKLLVNGKNAYQAVFAHPSTEILGIKYEFLGTGSVDYCRFSRLNGEPVFSDSFTSRADPATSEQ